MKIKIFIVFFYVYIFLNRCYYIQNTLIDTFTPSYNIEAKELKPEFISKDKERKKILLNLKEVFSGLPQITSIVPFPLNSELFFATIKTGELMIYNFSTKEANLLKKFDVLTASEQGLLGIAFHPDFKKNNLLYLYYSVEKNNKKHSRISEFVLQWEVSKIKNNNNFKFFLSNERILLEIEQPYSNHNGGHLEFGPDGYLYIGLGDGGWRDDPHNHSQNLKSLLGKILRINPQKSQVLPYTIPDDNPFTKSKNCKDCREEIFALGLRNPWKFSFIPNSNKLIVADVGQDEFEEISIVEKGKNYGWRIKEGYNCYLDRELCRREDLIDPIYVYDHSEGQSITGGYIYSSSLILELKNKYIFGDFVQGKIWAIEIPKDNKKINDEEVYAIGKWPILISTFGLTNEGEVLICDYKSGKIYKFSK